MILTLNDTGIHSFIQQIIFLSVSFYQVLFCVLGSLEMNMVEHFWKFLSLWYFYSNWRQLVYKIISGSGGSD